MKKRVMIMAICAVIAMGLAKPLAAQTSYATLGSLASNTNVATAGIFKNDVDNFVDYHKYSGVLKDDAKWFGFLTGRSTANGVLDAGYARYFGGIYLGIWYRGNVFRSPSGVYETNTITPTYDNTREDLLLQRVDTTSYTARWYESANNFEFLIGAKGMGFKIGFYESTATNKNAGSTARNVTVTDYLDGRKDYANAIDKYKVTRNYLMPYFGWGTTLPVSGMTLRPYIDISFLIYSDEQIDKYSSYTTVNGVKQNVVNTAGTGRNEGYYQPNGTVGAWLDLAKKNTVQPSLGLSYRFSMYMYSNSVEGLGNVNGTVRWNTMGTHYINRETIYSDRTETSTDMLYFIANPTNIQHTITPRYKITGEPVENFKLGFQATLPVIFRSESIDSYRKDITKTVVKYNNGNMGYRTEGETITYTRDYTNTYSQSTETSYFGLTLNMAFGASYQLIPNRFGINAGITASPIGYSQTTEKRVPKTTNTITTNKRIEEDGSVTLNDKTVTIKDPPENDYVTNDSAWTQFTGTLSGGFTFNFNNNAALDLAASSGSFTANTFNLTLTTVNVIFTFKF